MHSLSILKFIIQYFIELAVTVSIRDFFFADDLVLSAINAAIEKLLEMCK